MFEVLDGDALFEDEQSARACCQGYDAAYVFLGVSKISLKRKCSRRCAPQMRCGILTIHVISQAVVCACVPDSPYLMPAGQNF